MALPASSSAPEGRHWISLLAEMRRFPQMGYKSDSTIISGLDEGDMKAIDKRYKHIDLPCQLDKDDQRFVLKGTAFNPLDVINVLTGQRGYKMEYNPQQHSIPLKAGNADDKFAMIYHLSKPMKPKKSTATDSTSTSSLPKSSDPVPPVRLDSLPFVDGAETADVQKKMGKVDLT